MSRRKKTSVALEPTTQSETPGQVEQIELATSPASVITPLSASDGDHTGDVTPPKPVETRYGVIQNAKFVNVREAADPTSAVVRIANEGEQFIILYEESGYFKCEFEDRSTGFVLKDFVRELDPGETPETWASKSESILTSVKKILGVEESCEDFDLDIMMAINSAIFTLRQLGVGPNRRFSVTSKNVTYKDFLGEDGVQSELIDEVKMYFYYKVKLTWDSASLPASVIEVLKEQIKEAEWRLNVHVDPETTFEEG